MEKILSFVPNAIEKTVGFFRRRNKEVAKEIDEETRRKEEKWAKLMERSNKSFESAQSLEKTIEQTKEDAKAADFKQIMDVGEHLRKMIDDHEKRVRRLRIDQERMDGGLDAIGRALDKTSIGATAAAPRLN